MTTYETIKITELPVITNADGTAIKLAVQSGETSQITKDNDLSSSISSDANNAIVQGTDDLLYASNVTDVLTTKGDLLGYGTGYDRLPVGTDGQTIEADSAEPTGIKWVTPSAAFTPSKSVIDGFLIANDVTDSDHDILFNSTGIGRCYDSSRLYTLDTSTQYIKQIDATFATGNNGGGLADALTLTADTWYHCFVLFNDAGSVIDYGFDTSLTATNLLADLAVIAAGLTRYRRIGSVLTDGSNNILNGIWTEKAGGGLRFYYSVLVVDYNGAVTNTALADVTLSVPPNTTANLDVNMTLFDNDFYNMYNKVSGLEFGVFGDLNNIQQNNLFSIDVDLNSQIQHRIGGVDITNNLVIQVLGYESERIA